MPQFAQSSAFAVLCDSDADDEEPTEGKKKKKQKKKAGEGANAAPAKAKPVAAPAAAPAAAPPKAAAPVTAPHAAVPPHAASSPPPAAAPSQAPGPAAPPSQPPPVAKSKAAGKAAAAKPQAKAAGAKASADAKAPGGGGKKGKAEKNDEGSAALVAGNAFAALLEDGPVGKKASQVTKEPQKPQKLQRSLDHEPLLEQWNAAGGPIITEEEALERDAERSERLALLTTQELLEDLAAPEVGWARRRTLLMALAKHVKLGRFNVRQSSKAWHTCLKLIHKELMVPGKMQRHAMDALGGILAVGETRLPEPCKNSVKEVVQALKTLKCIAQLADAGEASAVVALRDLPARNWFQRKQFFNEWSDFYDSDREEEENGTGRLESAAGTADTKKLAASLAGLATALAGPRGADKDVRQACQTRLKHLSDTVAPALLRSRANSLAASLGSKAAPPVQPQGLRVAVPKDAPELVRKYEGSYALSSQCEHGYRTWQRAGSPCIIGAHNQQWCLMLKEAKGLRNEVVALQAIHGDNNKARMPHEMGEWPHGVTVKAEKPGDGAAAAKRQQWVVHKDTMLVGPRALHDHIQPEQAKLKCLQLRWCEGFCWHEDSVKGLKLDERGKARVPIVNFSRNWYPVHHPGCTSVHLEDPEKAFAENAKQIAECSPWKSMEALKSLLEVSIAWGEEGTSHVAEVLARRPAAVSELAKACESFPEQQLQEVVRILTHISKAAAGKGASADPSLELPMAVLECIVKMAGKSTGAKRTALLAVLAVLPAEQVRQAGALPALLPGLLDGEQDLCKLVGGLLRSGPAALDEALESGLLGHLMNLSSTREMAVAHVLEAAAEALQEPWSGARAQWQPSLQELLGTVLKPQSRLELQVAAVHMVPRAPSQELCERVVRIAEAGGPAVRIEALVSALQVRLSQELAARVARVCASALRAPKEPVRVRADAALADAVRAGRLTPEIFSRELLPLLMASDGQAPVVALGLLEAMVKYPDAEVASLLARGAAGAIFDAAEAGALDFSKKVAVRGLQRVIQLGPAQEVQPRLHAWLAGDTAKLKLHVARVVSQEVEAPGGLQRLLDSGLLARIMALPRRPEEVEDYKAKNGVYDHKEASETSRRKKLAQENFVMLARTVSTAAISAVRKARREQVQAVVDAGVSAWLCTALEVEISKVNKNKQNGALHWCYFLGYNQFLDEFEQMQEDQEVEASMSESIFLDVADAVLTVLKLGGSALDGLLSALTDVATLRTALRSLQYRKDRPRMTKVAAELHERLSSKQREKVLEKLLCPRCTEYQQRKGKGAGKGKHFCKACDNLRKGIGGGPKLGAEPKPGVLIAKCSPADLEMLKKLWKERGASGDVLEAWSVDNPLLAWRQRRFAQDFKTGLGRAPDELRGFHGTPVQNVLSIVQNGFDAGKRCGQAYGAGEYFAKNPDVSKGYCRGDSYMLVCQLCLGQEASDASLGNGDHIWVPSALYYVIAAPEQVVPLYILRYSVDGSSDRGEELRKVLAKPSWSTIEKAEAREIPPNRPAKMVAETTDLLWIGYLDPQGKDASLEADLHAFLKEHMPVGQKEWRLQVVRGRYTQAKVRLKEPLERAVVLSLCEKPFREQGKERFITVDDGHGSPEMPCPRTIAMYCRGQNLRYVDPCWCQHKPSPTSAAFFELEPLDQGAKADEIVTMFMKSSPFPGGVPKVVAINAVKNDQLATLHEKYKAYLRDKNKEEPKIVELYHGTNNKILDTVYTHGLQPPSDVTPCADCPISGGKNLTTSLCTNQCTKCTERHRWDKCHMFGLGIYLADLAAKSHRYVSEPIVEDHVKRCRMVLCSVAMGRVLELAGHLKEQAAMHDVQSLRGLWQGDLEGMVKPAEPGKPLLPAGAPPVEQHDLLFVKGLGSNCKPGYSVHNSEFISFHPYQCLPRYEIVYDIR